MSDWMEIVRRLGLKPHPEGGYFIETYRSSHSTAIYYLLPSGARSGWHRLKSDELFHHYAGGPMLILEIAEAGQARETVLGPDLTAGQSPQHVIKAGTWFGGLSIPGSPYALVGCTVAPPFEFSNFEMISVQDLTRQYPQAAEQIARLRP